MLCNQSSTFNKILLFLLLFLNACGQGEKDEKIDLNTVFGLQKVDILKELKKNSSITFPSKKDVEEGNVLEGSYIVVFRPPPNLVRSPFFRSYHQEYGHFYTRYLLSHIEPAIESISYLTHINLKNPGLSQWKPNLISRSPLRYFQDSYENNASKDFPLWGVIAQVQFKKNLPARGLQKKQGSGFSHEELLRKWKKDEKIWFAEPEYLSKPSTLGIFDDYSNQYSEYSGAHWLQMINLPQAFASMANKAPADSDVIADPPVIAVMDSGVDVDHPRLKDQIWLNSQAGLSGCQSDVYGCDTTQGDKGFLGSGDVTPFGMGNFGTPCGTDSQGQPNQVCSHGTHVAGIIAMKPESDAGGICPICKIMPIKVVANIGGHGRVPDSAIIRGLKYVSQFQKSGTGGNLVRVVNSSFGKFQKSRAVGLLIRLLKDSGDGILVVAASGNEDSMNRSYPAAFSDVISVAALDDGGRKATYSNFGPWVDLAAPGGSAWSSQLIQSTVPGESALSGKQGTSMATPVVAGVAGLVVATRPTITSEELRSILIQSADSNIYSESYADGYNFYNYYPSLGKDNTRYALIGAGALDADGAIRNDVNNITLQQVLNRVEPGCGSVLTDKKFQKESLFSAKGVFLISILFLVLYSQRYSKLRSLRKGRVSQ